jgi:DNA-binding transcriptional LysR family regulator
MSPGESMYNITFQQIEAFFSVARYRNLSNAADAMFVSQPALSKTLQRFEEGVGLKMFYRSNQGVSLTPEGEYLFSTLEPLYNNIEKTIATAHRISEVPPKTLNIIEPTTFDTNEDFEMIKNFIRQYEEENPNVVLVESLGDFKDIRRSLEYYNDDVAVIQEFGLIDMEGITYKRVSAYQLYLVTASDHKLSAHENYVDIDRELLAQEIHYRVPSTGEENDRKLTVERCRHMGYEPRDIKFVDNFLTLLHKIKTKKGVAICGKFTLGPASDDLNYLPLIDFDGTSNVVLAWKSGRLSREAKKLVEIVPGEEISL